MRTGHSSMNSARRGWLARCVVATFSIVNAAVCGTASAQCDDWVNHLQIPLPELGPTNGKIEAITAWDPDGAGPEPQWLVIGGEFTEIGDRTFNHIAAWDGYDWRQFESGMNDPVRSLIVYNGQLIAGGDFTHCGTTQVNRVAQWSGTEWQPLGAGFTVGFAVRDFEVHNGDLYACGHFSQSGAQVVYDVARWNGTFWLPVGPFPGVAGGVNALKSFNGLLYVGGGTIHGLSSNDDKQVASWNGLAWSGVGSDLFTLGGPPRVYALEVYNNTLHAGGIFSTQGNIVRLSGSTWVTVGAGLNHYVYALQVLGGDLVAGGLFTHVGSGTGGLAVNRIARWNSGTSTWNALGSGVNSGPLEPKSVRAMTIFNGILACGGQFSEAGSVSAANNALWNGNQWGALEAPREMRAFTMLGSRLIVGGQYGRNITTTGIFRNVSSWDGLVHSNLKGGVNNRVRALLGSATANGNELVVGGEFSRAGTSGDSVAATRVARWFDPQPGYPTGAWEPMGPGFGDTVYALTRHNGWLIAAGAFTNSGGTSVPRLAIWNQASGTWSWGFGGANNTIRAMKSFTTGVGAFQVHNLVIGGEFTAVDGVTRNRIARRTDTSTAPGNWFTMGDGFNDTVHAIERHNGEIYAAGAFTASGATPLNRIARWTGSAWVDVGGGFNNTVFTLYSHQGSLYAGGWFTQAGGLVRQRIARWNGSSWEEVRGGADNGVFAFGNYQSELHAGGAFRTVRNGAIETPGWGRFTFTGVPWVHAWSESSATKCGNNRGFTTIGPSGYSGFTRQWYKDGKPLTNGPTGYGSTISGAQSTTLLISSVRHDDAGEYVCIYTNACGQSQPHPPIVFEVFGVCCPADINADGMVNVSDLLAVIAAWGPCPAPCPADIAPEHTGDGVVNVSDLLLVIAGWGACP